MIILCNSIAMGSYILLYIYYIYSSFLPIRTTNQQLIFYTNSMITFIPFTLYTYNLINIVVYNMPLFNVLQFFIIEWTLTTPLILLNLSQIIRIKLYKQIILCLLSFLMNIFGFLSLSIQDIHLAILFYSLGCSCFLFIALSLSWLYYRRSNLTNLSNSLSISYLRFINSLFYTVIITWCFYPICFILYKLNHIDIEIALVSFMVLDFISKGIFIGNIIRYNEVLCLTDSFTNQIMSSISSSQIAPSPSISDTYIHIEPI